MTREIATIITWNPSLIPFIASPLISVDSERKPRDPGNRNNNPGKRVIDAGLFVNRA